MSPAKQETGSLVYPSWGAIPAYDRWTEFLGSVMKIVTDKLVIGQRDADREAEVESLRSRITELERRLSQMEVENAQLRSQVNNDYSLQLA